MLSVIKNLLSPIGDSRAAFARISSTLVKKQVSGSERPRVLVVGGGTVGLGAAPLYESESLDIIGFDIYRSPYCQLIADVHSIPFRDNSIDAVIIQAVLEHVIDPQRAVDEIWRVLKPKGLAYAETPFLQQVHEGPHDFTRFTHSGHRWLFRHFSEVMSGPFGGPALQLRWSFEFFARSLTGSKLIGRLTRLLLFWLPWIDRLIPHRRCIDNAVGFYFLGEKSDEPISPREAIKYYSGAQK